MSEIKVTFGALESARTDVAGAATRISGRLDDLRRAVAPLAATWDGLAAEEYRGRQRQWDTAAADLAGVLTDIGRALGDAEAGYRATENANAALWRRA
jgi:early secretory antigenic target protein ESAT-6